MAPRAVEELSTVLSRLETSDLTSQVHAILREKILNGDLQPDQMVSARTVGDALGVSMTPVRNALDRLAGEGLVVMSPRRGTRVASPTPEEIEEGYDLRLALEGYAAERAAARLTDAALAELERRWEAFGQKIPSPSRGTGRVGVAGPTVRGARGAVAPKSGAASTPVQVSEETARELVTLDRSFHEFIVELSDGSRLAQLYRTLELSLAVGRMYYLGNGHWMGNASHQQHRAIIDALATRDPAKARAAAEEHVRQARAGILAALHQRA